MGPHCCSLLARPCWHSCKIHESFRLQCQILANSSKCCPDRFLCPQMLEEKCSNAEILAKVLVTKSVGVLALQLRILRNCCPDRSRAAIVFGDSCNGHARSVEESGIEFRKLLRSEPGAKSCTRHFWELQGQSTDTSRTKCAHLRTCKTGHRRVACGAQNRSVFAIWVSTNVDH